MIEANKPIHQSLSAFIFMSAYFVGGFLFILYNHLFHSGSLSLVVGSFILLILFLVWLRSDYILITTDGIMRHYNYYQKRSLAWSEIVSVTTLAPKGQSKDNYSTIKICSSNPSKKDILINIRILTKNNVQGIAEVLIENTSASKCDEATKQLAGGIMPPWFVSKRKNKAA
jgi:hypothetical protein